MSVSGPLKNWCAAVGSQFRERYEDLVKKLLQGKLHVLRDVALAFCHRESDWNNSILDRIPELVTDVADRLSLDLLQHTFVGFFPNYPVQKLP